MMTTTPTNNDNARTGTDGVIQAITCYMVNCAECVDECWDNDGEGFTPHFSSEANLTKQLVEVYDWTNKHGRWLCRHCTEQADCGLAGHQWDAWRPSHSDIELVWRDCGCCGRVEGSLAALLPQLGQPMPVTTATNTGQGHTPTGRMLAVLRGRSGDELTAANVAQQAGLDEDLVMNQLLRLRAVGIVTAHRGYDWDTYTWQAAS